MQEIATGLSFREARELAVQHPLAVVRRSADGGGFSVLVPAKAPSDPPGMAKHSASAPPSIAVTQTSAVSRSTVEGEICYMCGGSGKGEYERSCIKCIGIGLIFPR